MKDNTLWTKRFNLKPFISSFCIHWWMWVVAWLIVHCVYQSNPTTLNTHKIHKRFLHLSCSSLSPTKFCTLWVCVFFNQAFLKPCVLGRSNQGRGLAFAGVGSLWWTPWKKFYLELCLHLHPSQRLQRLYFLKLFLLCFYFMYHA